METSHREKELFDQALDLAPEERAAFLHRECGDDGVLRARLQALLAAHDVTTAFLPPVPRSIAITPGDLPGEQPGDVLGRYKLLERVGEGGCGVVYVAEQTEPVRRRVALKVIKLGMDTKSVVARFEGERQALAMMDHPNIAKVLDAGATELGRPYFVMELVRGIPITHYCDQNQMSTQARLGLFIQVCQAVQHAHQKGIIHRDIKPSNILVTVNDGVPVPKVIDFGIAKATEGRLTDATIYTQLHQFIGTPAYMSPEQAEMTSLDIDTRSDIYSLGVLLYELLAGRTPFEAKELMAAGLDAMRRTIREQEPARPSTKLATLQGDERSTTAKRRATEAPKLLRQLQGDLDWIVMKCLEKDRTRRYETANGLAADLQRHLADEPVVARPPSTTYRLQKAYQRNKAAFAVAALIAVVLVAATAFSAWQARLAGTAAVVAQKAQTETAARERTERAAREEAEALAKFLGGVFRSPAPTEDGRSVTVAAALGRAAERVERDLAGQPARQATLQTAIAETYLGLNLFREAMPLLEKVLAHHRATLGNEHTNTLNGAALLADAYVGVGRSEDARKLRREVLELRERILGAELPETLVAMAELAESLLDMENGRKESIRLSRQVLAVRQRTLGPDHMLTKKSLLQLAYHDLSTFDTNSVRIAEEVLEWTRREKGPQHPETIEALLQLGYSTPMDNLNSVAKKIRLTEEALELSRRVFGPEHGITISAMGNLGFFLIGAERFTEAVRTFEEVVELSSKTYGPDHELTLGPQLKLAETYVRARRYEDAVRLGEETLRRTRRVRGDANSLGLFQAMAEVYLSLPDASRHQDATALMEEAARLMRQHRPDSAGAIAMLETLASIKVKSGQTDEAVQLFQQMEPLIFKFHGRESLGTFFWLSKVGVGYSRAGSYEDSIRLLELALPIGEKVGPKDDINKLQVAAELAAAYRRKGRLADWQRMLEAAVGESLPNMPPAQELAAYQVWSGDTAGYARLRERVLRGATNTADPRTAARAARLACLQPATDPAAAAQALKLARFGVTAAGNNLEHAWLRMLLGRAEHRSGNFVAAEQTLLSAEQAAESVVEWQRHIIQATSRFYRGMSLHQQGRSDEARTVFLEGEAAMRPLPPDGTNPVVVGEDPGVVGLWLAYRDAAALLQVPDDAAVQARRYQLRHRSLEAAVANDPSDSQSGMALGALQLWSGDTAGYADTRDRMLGWAMGTNRVNYWEQEWVAKLVSLTSDATAAVRADALTLARQAVALGTLNLNQPWRFLALGMAELRLGNLPAATAAFEVAAQPIANEPAQNHLRRTCTVGFYQALLLHGQGRTAEAREIFRATEAKCTLPADGQSLPVGAPDWDHMVLLLAHREAKALLGNPAPE